MRLRVTSVNLVCLEEQGLTPYLEQTSQLECRSLVDRSFRFAIRFAALKKNIGMRWNKKAGSARLNTRGESFLPFIATDLSATEVDTDNKQTPKATAKSAC